MNLLLGAVRAATAPDPLAEALRRFIATGRCPLYLKTPALAYIASKA